MTRQLGLAAVAQLALGEDQSELKKMVAGLAANGVLTKYSRDAERAADIYAVQEMYDAGIDPEGMATFFEKLLETPEKQTVEGLQQTFLDTSSDGRTDYRCPFADIEIAPKI